MAPPTPPERASSESSAAGSFADDFFSGVPLPIDPDRIERELSRLWKPDPSQTGAVTRACLSNLVFHFPDASARECAAGFLPELGRRFPSRRLLLTHRDAGVRGGDARGGSISAWITAVCHVPAPRAPAVCCEQIILEAPRDAVDLFPGTVLPLLVPDVPVILVLLFEGGEPLAEALDRLVDRVIVDSRFRPLESLRFLAGRLGKVGSGCRTADDLAWRAILPWRRLLADLFDEESILRRGEGLREVEVSYRAGRLVPAGVAAGVADGQACRGGPEEENASAGPAGASADARGVGAVPAALLGGWILSRLGWRPIPAREHEAQAEARPQAPEGTFERGGHRCTLRVRPVRSEGAPAEVLGIRIASEGGGRRAVLTVGAAATAAPGAPEATDVFTIHDETEEACVLPRRVPRRSEKPAALLGAAVERVTSQEVLRGAVEGALGLLPR
jgi:glucose-6-phosphate dehydrogenase assembly protein OpcA